MERKTGFWLPICVDVHCMVLSDDVLLSEDVLSLFDETGNVISGTAIIGFLTLLSRSDTRPKLVRLVFMNLPTIYVLGKK